MARRANPAPRPWEPKISLDLNTASGVAFFHAVADFEQWRTELPDIPLVGLADGWHVVDQKLAESVLLHNPAKANRKLAFPTVQYYADQFLEEEWRPTGQPIIFDIHGNLVDGQHRAWAAYLSGASFRTYVVNQDEEIPQGFAFIDNCKPRSNKDALQTAGFDGQSGLLSAVVDMHRRYEAGAYTADRLVHKIERISPHQVIGYAESRPNLIRACKIVSASGVSEVIGNRDALALMGGLVLDNYD